MPTLTSEGIIIKRSNFGEADRILTIVTRYKGKIRVIAKGVRRITSRRGGNVELLNKIKFQVFQGTGLPILTEAESLQTFPNIKEDLVVSSYASHLIELSEKFLPEDQPNPRAYQLLDQALNLLEINPRQVFIRAFEVKLLTVMGFWSADQIDTHPELRVMIDRMQKGSWEEINQIQLTSAQALELEHIFRYYIERILESSLKSRQIIEKLKK